MLNAVFPALAARCRLPGRIYRAAAAIRRCRTAALGSHARRCPEGHVYEVRYNSCRHRSCPTCAGPRAARWLAALQARLLPVRHYQLVFTIAEELRPLWRYNQAAMGEALFRAARLSVLAVLGERLGVCPGFVLALHTWGDELQLHPHLHGLITAGGLTPLGRWKPSPRGYLVWGPALRDAFRDRFVGELRRRLDRGKLALPPDLDPAAARLLFDALGATPWHVRIEKPYAHGRGLAVYLARYLRGGPVKDHRLCDFDGERVSFRCRQHRGRNGRKARWVTRTLPAPLFVRRLLEHVPPRGFHVVRAAGLYATRQRLRLDHARAQLLAMSGVPDHVAAAGAPPGVSDPPDARCPVCGRALETVPWTGGTTLPQARAGPLPALKNP